MKFNRIVVTTTLPLGAVIEFAALCIAGWISTPKIVGSVLAYEFALTNHQIVLTFTTHPKADGEAIAEELLSLLLGLFSLGAAVEAEGDVFDQNQLNKAIAWANSIRFSAHSLDEPIHRFFRITLMDLEFVFRYLADRTTPISNYWNDQVYASNFPYLDVYAGDNGSIRHKSGAEISIEWTGNKFVRSHKLVVPRASDAIVSRYRCEISGKKFKDKKIPLETSSGPYRKSFQNQMRAARMLGQVPPEHQQRVFAWFSSVFNDVDYFHDTRGGIPLPNIFEIEFDGCKMTATHDFDFKLYR